MSYTWDQFDEIFNISAAKQAQSFTDEQFAVCLEFTIALPQKDKHYKQLSIIEKTDVYRQIYEKIKAEYQAVCGSYTIEYHANGNPHMHGYLEVLLHPNVYHYPTEELLRMFAKSIFLMLPRSCYKQFSKAEINEYLKRFKSPAVTLNIKNVLSKNWVTYINKNAVKT